MRDAVIGETPVEFLELAWEEDLNPRQLAERFQAWLSDCTFVERKLPDLKEATFCQLTIDPT
jgi:hypothetical protein